VRHSGHEIELQEEARHSGLCEFHNCAFCREVSRRELFTKKSLPLVKIALFWSLARFMTIGEDGNKIDLKTEIFAAFETSHFVATER